MTIRNINSVFFLAPTKIFDAEEEIETEEIDEDDSTTHTFDRLSSAATCLVAGVEYTHGQQVR